MTQDLIKGAIEFKHYHYDNDDNNTMKALAAKGQDPKYFIISCIDSRCNPGTIFRAKPGIFFAHKAMGAIVRPYKKGTALAAALQFALEYNNIQNIIILGHTQCGGIKALADNMDDPEISSFVSVAKDAHNRALSCCNNDNDTLKQTEQNVIVQSAENLKTYPCVKKALSKNAVSINSWQFDMTTGNILEYNDKTLSFDILTNDSNPHKDGRKNV